MRASRGLKWENKMHKLKSSIWLHSYTDQKKVDEGCSDDIILIKPIFLIPNYYLRYSEKRNRN